jgi:light-regulated signal transduction histidine kinase (bacteriophytochrome)
MSALDRYAVPIVETVRQPLVLLTTDFHVITANAAYYRLFTTCPQDVERRSLYDIDGGAWNRPDLRELLEQVLPQQLDVREFVFTQTFPALGPRSFIIDARRLQDPDATSASILVALEDRTQQIAAATQSRITQAELNRSNRELEEFASIAAHDLQEPLRKVRAFGQRLHARSAAALDDTSRDHLDRMINAAARMSRLIDDVLRVARVSHAPLNVSPVDLDQLVREIAGDDVAVSVGTLPVVEGDRGQLRQLFHNLLENARKFHRPGQPARVSVTAATVPPDHVAISVQDDGIGIAEEHLTKIFVMFQRLHGRTEYEGTGIGLALCRRIAERHGGSIHVTSAPGAGSTFTAVLPRSQSIPEERPR